MNSQDAVVLRTIAYRLQGYAQMLDEMSLALDGLYLREISARLLARSGVPEDVASEVVTAKYGLSSKGDDILEQDEPPRAQ